MKKESQETAKEHAGIERARQLIEKGTEIVGTTAGPALGILTGNPWIGVTTAAITASGAYQRVGSEIANRWLGPREEVRAGAVLGLSAQTLERELKKGRKLRNEELADTKGKDRPAVEEVLESIVQKAQKEYEERKLPYLGNLWAEICLDKKDEMPHTLSLDDINYLLKLTEQLTYRQFVIITIIGRMVSARENIYGLRTKGYTRGEMNLAGQTAMVLNEIHRLIELVCLATEPRFGTREIIPAKIGMGTYGWWLWHTMRLYEIPSGDLRPVITLLR